MRTLIGIAVIVLILVVVGWVQFGTIEGDPSLRVDTDKIKQDTSAIVDEVKEAAEDVDQRVDVDIDTDPESVEPE